MKSYKIINLEVVFIILFLVTIVVCNSGNLPVCKTCVITAEGNPELNIKFGWENEQVLKEKQYHNNKYIIYMCIN